MSVGGEYLLTFIIENYRPIHLGELVEPLGGEVFVEVKSHLECQGVLFVIFGEDDESTSMGV